MNKRMSIEEAVNLIQNGDLKELGKKAYARKN